MRDQIYTKSDPGWYVLNYQVRDELHLFYFPTQNNTLGSSLERIRTISIMHAITYASLNI